MHTDTNYLCTAEGLTNWSRNNSPCWVWQYCFRVPYLTLVGQYADQKQLQQGMHRMSLHSEAVIYSQLVPIRHPSCLPRDYLTCAEVHLFCWRDFLKRFLSGCSECRRCSTVSRFYNKRYGSVHWVSLATCRVLLLKSQAEVVLSQPKSNPPARTAFKFLVSCSASMAVAHLIPFLVSIHIRF